MLRERHRIERTSALEVVECGECYILFAIPEQMVASCKRDGKIFHCPNGHGISYRETENQRLQRELDKQKIALSQSQANARWQREQREATERSLIATRGVVTRLKKRVSNGVCPCYNRAFQNLARHMQGQHPDYAGEDEASRGA